MEKTGKDVRCPLPHQRRMLIAVTGTAVATLVIARVPAVSVVLRLPAGHVLLLVRPPVDQEEGSRRAFGVLVFACVLRFRCMWRQSLASDVPHRMRPLRIDVPFLQALAEKSLGALSFALGVRTHCSISLSAELSSVVCSHWSRLNIERRCWRCYAV